MPYLSSVFTVKYPRALSLPRGFKGEGNYEQRVRVESGVVI